jgi:hypothetical protein
MSVTWNYLVIGGAYNRIIALPFVFISVALAYRYVRNINESITNTKIYIASVVVFTVLAVLHPLIWQWTFLFVLGIFTIGINGWKQKLLNIIKTIMPVAAFSAWMYIPLFRAYGTSVSNDTTLMQFKWLIDIPTGNAWSVDLGPLILIIAFIGLIITGIHYKRIMANRNFINLELKLIALFIVFSIYFFVYGWLPMPGYTYLMAAYDYAFWLGVGLIILSLFTFAMLSQAHVFQNMWMPFKTLCETIFLPVIILVCFVIVPFLSFYSQAQNPENIYSLPHNINMITDIAKANSSADYRLQNDQRRLTATLYYADSSINITGGRSGNAPNKYFSQWSNASISYRMATQQEIQGIYFGDLPKFWPSNIAGENDYYSPMFWLDWYGASGSILLPSIYPQYQTAEGYSARPNFFQQYVAHTNFGDMFFYKYADSSPITITTTAHVVAVPFQQGDAPSFYTDFINILSSLNLNSQWIIPVKMDQAKNLAQFDTALVEYANYTKNKDTLDKFVQDGGHLIVIGAGNSAPSSVIAQLPDQKLSFQVMASPLPAPDNSTILAETQDETLAYETPIGKGIITFSGISLSSMINSDSTVSAILLAEEVAPEIKLDTIEAETNSTTIPFITNGTIASVTNPPAPTSQNDNESSLTYIVNSSLQHNQVNWGIPLPQLLPADSNAIIHFSLWSDGNPISEIGVTLEQEGKAGYLYYDIPDKVWNGWKDFTIPLSYFQWKEGEQIDHFDSLYLCFNDDPPYQSEPNAKLFKVRDVSVTTLTNTSGYSDLGGTWQQADKFIVKLGNNKVVLWKESYMPSWKVTDDKGRQVDYYFAGPGMIYIVAPKDATSLTFVMPVPTDRIIGIVISVLSFVGFISFLLIKRKISVRTRLTNRSD